MNIQTLRQRVRALLIFFITALVLSGLTAFPLEWELGILVRLAAGPGSPIPTLWPGMAAWITYVNEGLQTMYRQYPFIAYGTDWLAFAHIVIAIAFGIIPLWLCRKSILRIAAMEMHPSGAA